MSAPLLEVEDLVTGFPLRTPLLRRVYAQVQAVAGISFRLEAGETLGIVGESGCGKSTLARTLVGLERPQGGRIRFEGEDTTRLRGAGLRALRRRVQMIFQDPFASLNPWLSVGEIVSEAWEIHPDLVPSARRQEECARLLTLVGLEPAHARRYPHQFSGGQRQRIGIARALAVKPRLLVCDEPVSALDVSIQAQIVNLFADLQKELGLSLLFIAHDLAVVRHLAHRVAVMYLGRFAEIGPTESVFGQPAHPYTAALLAAAPAAEPWAEPERDEIVLEGDVPSPAEPPSGCRFRTRCWLARERCARDEPLLVRRPSGQDSACHFAGELASAAADQQRRQA